MNSIARVYLVLALSCQLSREGCPFTVLTGRCLSLHIFEIFIVGAAENVDLHRSAGQTRSAPKEASRVDPSKITCLFSSRIIRSSSVENRSVFSSVIELTDLVRSISFKYYLEY